MKLEGRGVLVTGGARGMGLRIARLMRERGARVAIWDIHPDALAAARQELGDAVFADAVDVGDPEAVDASAARIPFPVDALVNNAGVVSGKRFAELTPEEVRRTLRVNLEALFWTTRAFLPGMAERGRGHLVTMASAGGLVGVPALSDYCASKFGAVGFHESIRAEIRLAAPGVGTTLVCPFFVNTGMFAGVRTRFPFLLPILDPQTVAAATVRAVERNRAMVVLPRFVHSLKLLRLLPPAWLDPIAAFFGIHASMRTFTGRPQ